MSKKLIAGAGVVASFAIALAPLATFADTVNPSDQHTDELVVTVLPSCTFGSAKKTSTGDYKFVEGIQHDASTGNTYGADTTNGEYTATAWNRSSTTETGTGTDEGGHNNDDVESTGYGILDGEGGVVVESGTEGQEGYVAGNNRYNASEHTVHRSMLAGTKTDTFAQTTMWVVCNNDGGYSITATAAVLANGNDSTATGYATIPVNGSYGVTSSGYTLKTIEAEQTDGMTVANSVAALSAYSDTLIASRNNVSKETGDSLTVTYGMGIASAQKADTYAGKVTYKLYKGVSGAGN